MPVIHLTTFIEAAPQRVFDLSRSIDIHIASMKHTSENAIAGKTSGLIELHETVTWQAKHFFKQRTLQVKITAMNPYSFFKDEMMAGDFKMMKHEHYFKEVNNGTIMIDMMEYELPYHWFGRVIDMLFFKKYFSKLLEQRNGIIKDIAETDKWKTFLR